MKMERILLSIIFASMLAITGCGGDGEGDGTGATNGTGATGGGDPSNSCEAFCGSRCTFMDVDPGDNFDACVNQCSTIPGFDDQCGSEAQAVVSCLEANDCPEENVENLCRSEILDWGGCFAL